jgi:hypothetical protein
MNPLRLELYTAIHQRQFNELLSRKQDKVTSFRNRVFLANTIRETGFGSNRFRYDHVP